MDWLTREILTGFQKLLCLSLDRTPAGEVIPGTAQAWAEALTTGKQWDEARDVPRIRAAFVNLMRTARTWPSPAHFLEALPAATEFYQALPRPKADPAKVQAIFDELGRKLRVAR